MKKSDEIIQRYIKGVVYEESEFDIILNYGADSYKDIINKLNHAVKDFLENADIQDSNEIRNEKEFRIFANAHGLGLTNENSKRMFKEILELVFSNRTIRSEYQWEQEKSKNLITKK